MGILSGIVNLWKKKNKLRSKISPISREIDKGLGLDKIWDLPGGQLVVQPKPTFDFSEEQNNVLRLGSATVNAGGYRAVSPNSKANGVNYPGGAFSDTLTPQAAPGVASPVVPFTAGVPTVGAPAAPNLDPPIPRMIPTPTTPVYDPTNPRLVASVGAPGLGTIRQANSMRPYTL